MHIFICSSITASYIANHARLFPCRVIITRHDMEITIYLMQGHAVARARNAVISLTLYDCSVLFYFES